MIDYDAPSDAEIKRSFEKDTCQTCSLFDANARICKKTNERIYNIIHDCSMKIDQNVSMQQPSNTRWRFGLG